MRGGDSDRMSRPPSFRPLTNRQALTALPMRKDVGGTSVPPLAVAAYFGIANVFIPRACWLAKRSGPLICVCRDWDLTPEDECRSAKNYQLLMKEEVWKRMKGCQIGPTIMAFGPLGVRARWPGARAQCLWQSCRQIWHCGPLFWPFCHI